MAIGESSDSGAGVKDPIDEYDRKHGRTTLKEEQRCVDLGEGSNKEPPQDGGFKVTGGK